MLNVINIHYKFINFISNLYVNYIALFNINFEKNVRQYKFLFRKINIEIVDLNDSLSLLKFYFILFFFMKFDEMCDVFIMIYIQIYMLYKPNVIKFNLIIYDVINKKRRLLLIKKNDIIILVHRNNKNKQFIKNDFDDFNFINREMYVFYKIVNHNFKHFFIKC